MLPDVEAALDWLTGQTQYRIKVVSNHEEMLKEMWWERKHGKFTEQFSLIHFVYLHMPKERVAQHLLYRPPEARQYTLDNYDRFHQMYSELADETVQCADKYVMQIADEVQAIRQGMKFPNQGQ